MEFYSPQQISGIFDFLPWVWARCPGWRGVVQVPQPKVRRGPWESLDKLSLSKRGELEVQVVLLREMRQECSCSLLSDRITHQLHVSLVFMQHVNYKCDPYKLFPEQPINCWGGWLKKAFANIGLAHPAKSIRALNAWIFCWAKPTEPYFSLSIRKDKILSQRWNII